MADIDFPTDIIFQSRGFSVQQTNPVRRTVMEDGQTKQARRSQKRRVVYSVQYRATEAEYLAFITWYEDEAFSGAKFFNWIRPTDESTVEARIIGGQFAANPITLQMDDFLLEMQIEEYR